MSRGDGKEGELGWGKRESQGKAGKEESKEDTRREERNTLRREKGKKRKEDCWEEQEGRHRERRVDRGGGETERRGMESNGTQWRKHGEDVDVFLGKCGMNKTVHARKTVPKEEQKEQGEIFES